MTIKCVYVWYCGVPDFKRKLKKAHQCGSRQNQVCVCQVWKLKSGGGSMPWPTEVVAVVQDRRQMWLMTLGAAPKRWLKNGNLWTSIRWSMGEVVCWLILHRLVKMAAVWRRHRPYHLGNRRPCCHPRDHRRSCHPLQHPRCLHRMLQVGYECASDWAAVREKCIIHGAVGFCYRISGFL